MSKIQDVKIPALPGDVIVNQYTGHLRIATGISPTEDDAFIVTRTGYVRKSGFAGSSFARPILWVDSNSKRYEPQVEDMIIGTITEKTPDSYKVDIGGRHGVLSNIAFDGATRKNRPMLDVGSMVYCRVSVVNKYLDPELSCMSLVNKRDWVTGESVFGELKGGTVVKVSIRFAHELMGENPQVLDIIGNKLRFEIAIGVNGIIWINSDHVRVTIIISNILSKVDKDRDTDVDTLLDRAVRVFGVTPN